MRCYCVLLMVREPRLEDMGSSAAPGADFEIGEGCFEGERDFDDELEREGVRGFGGDWLARAGDWAFGGEGLERAGVLGGDCDLADETGARTGDWTFCGEAALGAGADLGEAALEDAFLAFFGLAGSEGVDLRA